MDSNHKKSEVKVVFIRNGFHTTLLHKTRKKNSLSIWNWIPINGLCKNKNQKPKYPKFLNPSRCPKMYNTSTVGQYCTFGQYFINYKKVKEHPMYIHIQSSEVKKVPTGFMRQHVWLSESCLGQSWGSWTRRWPLPYLAQCEGHSCSLCVSVNV